MFVRRFIFIGLVGGVLLNAGYARADSGKNGFAFLKIGIGGKQAGMGEATAATVTDATAGYWNPAGLAWNDMNNVSFTYNRWIEEVTHNAFCGKIKWGSHYFGLHYVYTGVDNIEQRQIPSEEPTAYFSSHDLLLGVSWARKLGDRWSAGLTTKYLYERIQNSVQAVALDIGVWYKVRFVYDNPDLDDRWRIGMVIANAGLSGKMVHETVRLPLTLRAGTSYDIIRNETGAGTLALDVIKIRNENIRAVIGMEYTYRDLISFRAGYQAGYASRSLTAGLGARVMKTMRFDYGFMPMSNGLGSTHRFTASFDF